MDADELPHLDPRAFRREHTSVDPDADLAGMVFGLDLQERQPSIQRLRDSTRRRLAPSAGETAVDVGCGTGTEVARLAELVGPTGRAVGVEPHAGLRAEAVRRLAGTTAEVVDGEALGLPFADGSVDVLRCERVWQHLPDLSGAAAEIARVLAPGGRAAVVDTDWGTLATWPGDEEVLRRYEDALRRRQLNPYAGRRLRAELAGAGLVVDPEVEGVALALPQEMLLQGAMVRSNVELAVEEGALTEAEAETFVGDLVAAARRGEAFSAVTIFAAVARRP